MNTTYMYPENLKAKTDLWLWSLRDFAIIAVALLLSILALVELGLLFPAAFTLCFGFLTIRMGDSTIMDYLTNAVVFFITAQQYFEWR